MKNKTVCFSGHRRIPQSKKKLTEKRVESIIIDLIKEGYTDFISGGAPGFDTIAAERIINLRKRYPEIKLILTLPCIGESRGWSDKDKRKCEKIKSVADKIIYTSEEYTRDCVHKRNRHLVDNSEVCVCYLMENKGGTFYTVDYARKKGLKIINTAE